MFQKLVISQIRAAYICFICGRQAYLKKIFKNKDFVKSFNKKKLITILNFSTLVLLNFEHRVILNNFTFSLP